MSTSKFRRRLLSAKSRRSASQLEAVVQQAMQGNAA